MTSERFMRLPQVVERVGLSRAVVYRMVADGDFPRPVKIGKRAIAWPSSVIDQWIQARIDEAQAAED